MTGIPAISGKHVYVGKGNRARCFDLRTGNPVWKWDKPDRGPLDLGDLFSGTNSILVLGDLVIFCDYNFTILESETGKALYVKHMAYDGWAHTGACHDENTIFLPSGHRLYTMPLRSRSTPGSIIAEGKITAGPIAFRGKIIYGNNRGEIVAHDADSGKQIWSFSMEGQVRHTLDIIITSRPAGWEDRVIFGGGDGCCYALAADTGQKIWKADTGQALISPPIVVGDTVFILSEQAELVALNAHDGTVLWHATTGDVGELSNEMAFSEGLLLVGSMGVSAWRSRK